MKTAREGYACDEIDCKLYHATVADNGLDGLLFDFTDPSSDQFVKCYNCVFWDNTGEDVDDSFPGSPSGFWYCNWNTGLGDGGTGSGPGCIKNDPYFDSNLHLGYSSDSIDQGRYALDNGLEHDFEGDDRELYGKTREETDPGADEYSNG